MTNKKRNIAAGFTLVETLVAVLILSVAIAGPLTIASRGLNAALIAKDQTTAFYLVQDAVEYVRFKRDTYQLCLSQGLTTGNCVGATSWLGDPTLNGTLAKYCTSGSGCYVDSLADTIKNTGGNCSSAGILKYDSTAGHNYYSYSGALPITACSIYNRSVKIISLRADEAQLNVSVSWKDIANVTHAISVTENLFNWQQ